MSVGFSRIIQIRLFEQNTLKSFILFCEFRICRENHSECASGGSFFAYFLNVCKKYGGGWEAQRSPERQRQRQPLTLPSPARGEGKNKIVRQV